MTISSSAIKSSTSKSEVSIVISLRRLSPYFSFIAINSSLMISRWRSSEAKMAFKSAINTNNAACSSSIFSRSKPVKRAKRISKIAFAWISVRLNFSIKAVRAISVVWELWIVWITSSMWSKAISKPSNTWARASAFAKSNSVRRTMTSWRCVK